MKSNIRYPAAPFSPRFSWRDTAVSVGVPAVYLLVSALLIGYKQDQLVLATLFFVLYAASAPTRKFILSFSIFIVFWILFDYMKAFPNYAVNGVHVRGLYEAERSLFGVTDGSAVLTPNEFWESHAHVMADVLSGLFYLCWVPVPLGFAAFLFYKDRQRFLEFSLTFLLTNLVGFVIYYLYPAAPPWYVKTHGFDVITGTAGNAAGLVRFDDFFEVNIFRSMYTKSSNVFAAMPSLHSAYPLIVVYFSWKKVHSPQSTVHGKYMFGWVKWVFVVVAAGIWFAAVYTGHHYVLDVLAGIATAGAGIALFRWMQLRNAAFKRFLHGYAGLIS